MNLKPGTYQCEVTAPSNGWFGTAGEKKTPFIRILLVVTSGAHEGEEVVYQAWITDSAKSRTIKTLKEVFDWNGNVVELARLMDTGPFVGKACSIECESETYKEKTRTVIKWLNKPDGGGKMMEANRALQFAMELQKSLGEPEMSESSERRPRQRAGADKPKEPDADWPEVENDENPY